MLLLSLRKRKGSLVFHCFGLRSGQFFQVPGYCCFQILKGPFLTSESTCLLVTSLTCSPAKVGSEKSLSWLGKCHSVTLPPAMAHEVVSGNTSRQDYLNAYL